MLNNDNIFYLYRFLFIVYKFECSCSKVYIGESKRQLLTRIDEHADRKYDTAVSRHIEKCSEYLNNLKDELGSSPTDDEKLKFINKKFSLTHKFK